MKRIITLAASASLLIGCGEQLEGTYITPDSEPAEILTDNCYFTSGKVNLEVIAKVSGNDIEVNVVSLTQIEGERSNFNPEVEGFLGGLPYNAKIGSNNNRFDAYASTFNNEDPVSYDVRGNLNTSRDEITGLTITQTVQSEVRDCEVRIRADRLELQK